ncbi:MAG TPA: type II toxin-antitoxin system VapB family antitoxin [Herpetosiphonaceae bacterium]|jgi:antitoxin VapB|nr:type II toxin-antitoxin system VapB family antitoxin [Herpetosiphonaceae bacterium]
MRTARLFQNGQSQAVRLPKEFRFSGDRVYIKRVGSAVVLLSYEEPWEPLIASITLFSEDFMDTREEPPQQEREAIFP